MSRTEDVATRAEKESSRRALTSAASAEWGTPKAVVALQHLVFGGPADLDPASSDYWNRHTFQAKRFYDQRQNGLKQPWFGNVAENPPDKTEGMDRGVVRAFWEKGLHHWRRGEVDALFWVGFSLEQLVSLQSSPMHPLQFVTVVPCARLAYLARPPGGGPPTPGASPTHGSYLTLLPSSRSRTVAQAQMRLFQQGARSLAGGLEGALVRPM